MLRRTMSSVFPNSLSLLRPEQVKKTSQPNPALEDSMSSLTRALLAVKKVDKKVPVIQQSFLIGSLLEQLCSLYETDEAKSKKLYYALCEQLAKWNIISPVAYLEEFTSVQTQYRNALYNIIQSSLSSLNIDPTRLPAMLDAKGETSKCKPIVVDRDKVFNFELSRYRHEFIEQGKLGSGGYGNVYRAESKIDGQEYAIKKVILRNSLLDERNDALLREVKVLASLRHKNVVQYHSAWIEHETESPKSNANLVVESSLDSDDVIPFTSRAALPHADSFLLESSEPEDEFRSFDDVSSGKFGSVTFLDNERSAVFPFDGKISAMPGVSKFWNHSSASEATGASDATGAKDSGRIQFTISSAGSDDELDFEDSSPVDFTKKMPHSPPKEVIMTDGVKRDLHKRELHKVKSFIYSRTADTPRLKDLFRNPRNRSFSSMADRDFQNTEEISVLSTSGELLKFKKPISNPNKLVLYMQMQLCQMSLKHWLSVRNRSISNGKRYFHESPSFRIMKQIASALLFIHSKNLIHRDIKPANIFLNDEDNPHILVGDFGLAKSNFDGSYDAIDENTTPVRLRRIGSHTSGVGTTTYAAPEQLVVDVYDAKVDMYSFGIVIYELWTPFNTGMERARQIKLLRNHHIPDDFIEKYPELGRLITSLLDHNPKLRPSSSDLLKNEFFEKSKDRVIDDQFRKILSLENEIDELKIANKRLTALLEGKQPVRMMAQSCGDYAS